MSKESIRFRYAMPQDVRAMTLALMRANAARDSRSIISLTYEGGPLCMIPQEKPIEPSVTAQKDAVRWIKPTVAWRTDDYEQAELLDSLV